MEKYSSDLVGSAFMVLAPGFQLAGHTSPCSSVNCNGRPRGHAHMGWSISNNSVEQVARVLSYQVEAKANDGLQRPCKCGPISLYSTSAR